MADTEQPQIYLIAPPDFKQSSFGDKLSAVLDAVDIACLRLAPATSDEDRIICSADALREIAHARDIPLVIEGHMRLIEKLGLDGIHLIGSSRSVANARKTLGPDAIIGAFCGASRHDGMSAGEAGADYVAYGPAAPSSPDDENYAGTDLFAWWSETIELPVVAEGALDSKRIEELSPFTDFLGIGPEIWQSDSPAKALKVLLRVLN